MSEKWQVAVYKIHNTTKDTKEVFKVLENTTKSYAQKQTKLLGKLLIVEGSHKYSAQKLRVNNQSGFDLYLFYRKHPKAIPNWKTFFKSRVEEGEVFHIEPRNMNESFVFFLYHSDTKSLYAVAGGYGAFTIQKFIKDDFGIEILVRIIDGKGEKILRHAKEFGVTGGIVGMAKYFRQHYNFYENQNFGNIYREISASIDKDIARDLGISTEETKQCIAKNSFKINQSISYNEMIVVVEKLNTIIQRDENFSVNDIKLIDVKKEEVLVKNLEKKILDKIWDNRNDILLLEESLDFIHKDFENFLLASKFKFAREQYEDNLTLFVWIMRRMKDFPKRDYLKNIKKQSLRSYDSESDPFSPDSSALTQDTIFNHLIYEVSCDGESYFLINGKYYQITNGFKNTLNESCKNFIVENYDNGLDKEWNTGTEGEYNILYKGEANTVVLDTVTPENIEPCDVLKYDDEYVYLYHVKKGFNGSMRDLTNQVLIASNRILEDLKSDKRYLKNVYLKMQGMDNYKDQVNDEDDFLSIFTERKLCFVLAVKDEGNNRRLEEIERFTSNIAKFALNELIQNMRTLGVDFKITQINAPDKEN
jgi:uncharacterized protein (TIGR04141 family)